MLYVKTPAVYIKIKFNQLATDNIVFHGKNKRIQSEVLGFYNASSDLILE